MIKNPTETSLNQNQLKAGRKYYFASAGDNNNTTAFDMTPDKQLKTAPLPVSTTHSRDQVNGCSAISLVAVSDRKQTTHNGNHRVDQGSFHVYLFLSPTFLRFQGSFHIILCYLSLCGCLSVLKKLRNYNALFSLHTAKTHTSHNNRQTPQSIHLRLRVLILQ